MLMRFAKKIEIKDRDLIERSFLSYDSNELQNEITFSEQVNSNIDDRNYLKSKGILYYIVPRDSHIILPSDYRHFGVLMR